MRPMVGFRSAAGTLWVAAALSMLARLADAAATVEVVGTYHAMGIVVTLDPGDDPDQDMVATVDYRTGSDPYTAGFPLTRTRDTQLVGSLFWLEPGTSYDVRVMFVDPDGGPLDGATVSGNGATRGEIVIPPPVRSLVVSTTGSGTACTEPSPCSLDEGIAQAVAGDEIVLRGGVYQQGEISQPRSGSAGAPIVIRAHDGETPILDASDPQTFTWVHSGGGVYVTTVDVGDTHLVVANGARLYPYQSLADLQSLVWGIPGFYSTGTTLSVRLAGDADPNAAEMRVSRYNYALSVASRDFIFIIGLTFRFYGQGSYAKAIYLNGSSDCLVRDCTFLVCDLGVGLKYGADRNTIEGNEFSDTTFSWIWESIKEGAQLETGGIRVYDSLPSGRGTVIRDNTFHDFFDGFGVCPDSDTGTTVETDVYGNLVYRAGDDGMETDGYCSNLRIWGNTFHDVLIGVSLAPVYTGPVFTVRNLIYRTGAGTSDAGYTGSCFKLNSGYGLSGVINLFHNTCHAALPGNDGLAIKSPGSWQLLRSRNNIWAGTEYALSNANPTQPVDLDADDLYTTLPGELAWWADLPDRHLNTLAELQAATGQELAGLNEEPMFRDPATGDYGLHLASPLVDAGVLIPGINHDFQGAAPDIGAFEAAPRIFGDDFESGTLSAWSETMP
jgi:parallel beta-helix repeat protein